MNKIIPSIILCGALIVASDHELSHGKAAKDVHLPPAGAAVISQANTVAFTGSTISAIPDTIREAEQTMPPLEIKVRTDQS